MMRAISLVLLGALLAGCSARSVRISELKDQPGRYDDRPVSITGRITTGWGVPGILPFQVYNVDDGSGQITVVSQSGGILRPGSRIEVKGRISEVAVLGGESLGLHIREESRKVKN